MRKRPQIDKIVPKTIGPVAVFGSLKRVFFMFLPRFAPPVRGACALTAFGVARQAVAKAHSEVGAFRTDFA